VSEQAAALAALGRKCLIVTSGTAARRCGALDDVTAALEAHGVAYGIYDAIQPNPTMDSCLEGGQLARELGAEFIIGIGGGSPLDAAKVVAVSAANPELEPEALFGTRWANKPLPIALVGTTAGTGSEVTPISVLTDGTGRKRGVRDEKLYAALSLGDPRYTESMPLAVTASTGVDALAHCVESYFNRTATDISRAFALQGVAALLPPLGTVAEGRLPDAGERDALYRGSILGGMAISVAGTVLPHNMGYYLTENHGVAHGFACAAFLPALLRHAEEADPAGVRALERRVGADADALKGLLRGLVPDHGVRLTAEEIEALLPRYEGAAQVQNTVGGVTAEELRRILTETYGG
jgi:alcohol dehydrogenase class IV